MIDKSIAVCVTFCAVHVSARRKKKKKNTAKCNKKYTFVFSFSPVRRKLYVRMCVRGAVYVPYIRLRLVGIWLCPCVISRSRRANKAQKIQCRLFYNRSHALICLHYAAGFLSFSSLFFYFFSFFIGVRAEIRPQKLHCGFCWILMFDYGTISTQTIDNIRTIYGRPLF